MSKGPNRLSLGALPRSDAVKLTITLTAELKAQLDAYAEVHGHVHKMPVDATSLVPHMLAAFIARDRGFRTLMSKNEKRPKSEAAIRATVSQAVEN